MKIIVGTIIVLVVCAFTYNQINPIVISCGPVTSKYISDGESGHYHYLTYYNKACEYVEIGVSVNTYHQTNIGDTICSEDRANSISKPCE